MKTCSKCKVEKPLTDFWKCSSKKDGLNYRCKLCCLESKNSGRNPERDKETKRLWVEKNRAKVRQQSKKHYEKHRDIRQAQMRAYTRENPRTPEEKRESYLKRRTKHLELSTRLQKKYREELTASYIRRLCGSEITSEFIETKRLHLQVKRKLKELKA